MKGKTKLGLNFTILAFAMIIVMGLASAVAPTITFVSPSPNPGSNQTSLGALINATIVETPGNTTYAFFPDNLVLWLRLNNETGENYTRIIDWSTFGNNVTTLIGTIPQFNNTGYFGGAYQFNDTSTGVNLTTANGLNSQTITISAWVLLGSNLGNGTIFSYGNGTQIGYDLDLNAKANIFTFTTGNVSTGDQLNATGASTIRAWHHVVATFDGTNKTIYIDGLYNVSSNAFSGQTISFAGAVASLGSLANLPAGNQFNGTIDDVLVFNRALTQGEVSALYNATANGITRQFQGLSVGNQNISIVGVSNNDTTSGISVSSLLFTVTSGTSASVSQAGINNACGSFISGVAAIGTPILLLLTILGVVMVVGAIYVMLQLFNGGQLSILDHLDSDSIPTGLVVGVIVGVFVLFISIFAGLLAVKAICPTLG